MVVKIKMLSPRMVTFPSSVGPRVHGYSRTWVIIRGNISRWGLRLAEDLPIYLPQPHMKIYIYICMW